MLAELNRDRKKRPKPFTPDDFMPKKGQKAPDDEDLKEKIRKVNYLLGGKEKHGQ